MRKIFWYIFIIVVGVTLVGASVFWWLFVGVEKRNNAQGYEKDKAITVVYDAGGIHRVIIREEVAPWAKALLHKVSGRLYYEATLHNPEGDILPDTWDDRAKEYIKSKVIQESI